MKVDPMPDELALGYLGRITFIKSLSPGACRAKSSYFYQIGTGVKRSEKTPLAQLAMLSGLSETDYASRHSMLPILKVATRTGEDQPYGDPTRVEINRKFGMMLPKQGAYVCRHCVEEDMEDPGLSWFRRIHHLQGVDWCPKHRTGLLEVVSDNPWQAVPGLWIEEGKVAPVTTGSVSDESGFLTRFTQISCDLLRRTKPFAVDDLAIVLSVRSKMMGARLGSAGDRRLMTDMVRDQAPEWWSHKYWTELAGKGDEEELSGLNSIMKNWNTPLPGFLYAVLLATLFDSAAKVQSILDDLDRRRYAEAIARCLEDVPGVSVPKLARNHPMEESRDCLVC
jgi:hypothetical protein